MPEFGVTVEAIEGGPKRGTRYQFSRDINGQQTLEQLVEDNKLVTFSTARQILREEQRKGFDEEPRVRTDNVFERDDRLVKAFGKIEYFARVNVGPALIEIYQELDKRSPYVTGQFVKGNWLYFNGIKKADSLTSVEAFVKQQEAGKGFRPGDEIRIINVNPYARRLEYLGVRRGTAGRSRGKNVTRGRKKFKRKSDGATLQRPSGSYYLTYRLIRRKFKSLANVLKFTFIPGGSEGINIPRLPGFRNTFSSNNKGSRGRARAGRPYLYPTIVFKLSAEGIKGVNFE